MSESPFDETYRRAKWLVTTCGIAHGTKDRHWVIGPLSINLYYNAYGREFLEIAADGLHTWSGLMERVYRATNGEGSMLKRTGAEIVLPLLRQAMILEDLANA